MDDLIRRMHEMEARLQVIEAREEGAANDHAVDTVALAEYAVAHDEPQVLVGAASSAVGTVAHGSCFLLVKSARFTTALASKGIQILRGNSLYASVHDRDFLSAFDNTDFVELKVATDEEIADDIDTIQKIVSAVYEAEIRKDVITANFDEVKSAQAGNFNEGKKASFRRAYVTLVENFNAVLCIVDRSYAIQLTEVDLEIMVLNMEKMQPGARRFFINAVVQGFVSKVELLSSLGVIALNLLHQ